MATLGAAKTLAGVGVKVLGDEAYLKEVCILLIVFLYFLFQFIPLLLCICLYMSESTGQGRVRGIKEGSFGECIKDGVESHHRVSL